MIPCAPMATKVEPSRDTQSDTPPPPTHHQMGSRTPHSAASSISISAAAEESRCSHSLLRNDRFAFDFDAFASLWFRCRRGRNSEPANMIIHSAMHSSSSSRCVVSDCAFSSSSSSSFASSHCICSIRETISLTTEAPNELDCIRPIRRSRFPRPIDERKYAADAKMRSRGGFIHFAERCKRALYSNESIRKWYCTANELIDSMRGRNAFGRKRAPNKKSRIRINRVSLEIVISLNRMRQDL